MRRLIGKAALIGAIVALALSSAAIASTGSITKASTDATWNQGEFAGSVTSDICGTKVPQAACKWSGLAFAEPNTYSCNGADAWVGDPNIRGTWASPQQTVDGTASFDRTINLGGVYGQHACLFEMVNFMIEDPLCPILPAVCGLYDWPVTAYTSLNGAQFQVPAPPTPAPQPVVPNSTCSTLSGKKRKKCVATAHCKKLKGKSRKRCLKRVHAKFA